MLLESAIGDAYGSGFEYAQPEFVRAYNNLPLRYSTARGGSVPKGNYTDDTQMSIAIAELLVSGAPWTPAVIAQKFVECYKRDRRNGYAGGFKKFLDSVNDGDEFLRKIRPDSNKSGASMRAAPIGVLPDVAEVIRKCTIQAKLTHDTREGVSAACAASLLAHYCVYGLGPKAEVGKFIEHHLGGHWSVPYDAPVGSPGWQSVRAAITTVAISDSLSEVLLNSIAFTGDVDTVATIAMAAAAHSSEIENDLDEYPQLLAGLENKAYGRDFLAELDGRLMVLKGK
jgi:ADP-ribosyl-[dinitrogen reductase] hydrolase